jgi:shikimate kinase
MMGSGKSTIGRALAEMTGMDFIDLDDLIVEHEKITIPEIFAQKGEEGFRAIEKELLIRHAQNIKGVLALGGGALQNQDLVNHLKLHGWLVFLNASEDILFNRLKSADGRPMLSNTETEDLKNRIRTLLDERLPYYRQAHVTVQTGSLKRKDVAVKIIKKLKMYEA